MLTAAAYDHHLEQLLHRVQQLHELMTSQGIPYRIVGGMAVFIHVFDRDPLRARLTADVDAAIRRADLPAVIAPQQRLAGRIATSQAWTCWWRLMLLAPARRCISGATNLLKGPILLASAHLSLLSPTWFS